MFNIFYPKLPPMIAYFVAWPEASRHYLELTNLLAEHKQTDPFTPQSEK